MKPVISTWNSVSINNGSPLYAVFPRGAHARLNLNPVIVNRADDYPALTTAVKQGSSIVINVYVAAGSNINTAREAVKQYFFSDTLVHNLVMLDEADSNKPYYRRGIPIMLQEENGKPNSWLITIQTEYPYWQLVTAATDNWSITATGQTHAVTNSGNQVIRPIFTITPTTTKSAGLSYRRWVPIVNNMTSTYAVAMDITNGGLDTATLTTAKMQADGDDFRTYMDGIEVDRWLNNMDTAATKAWVNVSLPPPLSGTLGTSITDVATTAIFSQTSANLEFLTGLIAANNTTIMIQSEALVFDPTNVDLIQYQITGLLRGQKNTTAAAHTAPLTVTYIAHDLWILYGDSTLTAPTTNDNFKPIFDLSSTNGAWAFTNFFDPTATKRPGSWAGEVAASRSKLSYLFTGPDNTFMDPAASTALGLAERASQDFTTPHESATLSWSFNHPAGITDVTYSGSKYNTASWPGVVGLQGIQTNSAWFGLSSEAAPAVPLAWEDFGPSTLSLGATYSAIRFVMDGTLSSTFGEAALIQFDTVSTTFASANLPTITVGAEAAINFFDFKLTNNTTGEWIKIKTPCPVNSALTVNCETKTAYLADGRVVPVQLSTSRADWLNLAVGSNTLQFDDVGTVAVTLVTSHRDRIL